MLAGACGGDAEIGLFLGAAGTDGGAGAGGGVLAEARCRGIIHACGDTVDNDGDGRIDADDPDCLGPCDASEDSFWVGENGQTGPPCLVDCFFDRDFGSGNDACYWHHACDPLSIAPSYPPSGLSKDDKPQCPYEPSTIVPGAQQDCVELTANQSQQCRDYCLPLVPNGCDCFGCCEIPARSGNFVWLGSKSSDGTPSCRSSVASDPSLCAPCTPVSGCFNSCDECEVCIEGGPVSGCDAESDAGTPRQCGPGVEPCGQPGQSPCPTGKYCITGCCVSPPT